MVVLVSSTRQARVAAEEDALLVPRLLGVCGEGADAAAALAPPEAAVEIQATAASRFRRRVLRQWRRQLFRRGRYRLGAVPPALGAVPV